MTKPLSEMGNHGLALTIVLIGAVAVGAFIFAGCTQKQVKTSGFLGDYSALQPDPTHPGTLYYEKPGLDWAHYTKLMLDPVIVHYAPGAEERQIDPEELETLVQYFREAVIEKVQDAYPVVDEPGPDVLRIRAAVTDVIPANPTANVAAAVAVGIPLDMGGASIEAEFLDSVSQERIAALVDQKAGSHLDFIGGFTRWGHVKGAFSKWAKELRSSLDEVHPAN